MVVTHLINIIGYILLWAATDVNSIMDFEDKRFNKYWWLKIALICAGVALIKL
jgi:hypothetical protein